VAVDTSALIAILYVEPEAERFRDVIGHAPVRLISAVPRVELSFVVEGRKGEAGRQELDHLLEWGEFQLAPMLGEHAQLAIEAFRRFGKGRHPASLNIGDCFSYALAKATGYPLLYKGNDFALTGIQPAIPPRTA
jgi:ribonuclease VapC